MEGCTGVLNFIDQYALIHVKTSNFQNYKKDFGIVKSWLIENAKETENKFVIFTQNKRILTFCEYDIEKTTHKTISDLRENVVLSVVLVKKDNVIEKGNPSKSL